MFSAEPDIAAWFAAVLPSLPADWQLVLFDKFVTVIAKAPAFTYNNIVALYSTDPQAIPVNTAETGKVLIPYATYGLLVLVVLIVAPALRQLRTVLIDRYNSNH